MVEDAVGFPVGEVAVDGLVGREVVGQVAPGDAGAVDVEDGVDQGAQVVGGFADAVAGLASGFESGADEFPAGVGQVAGGRAVRAA